MNKLRLFCVISVLGILYIIIGCTDADIKREQHFKINEDSIFTYAFIDMMIENDDRIISSEKCTLLKELSHNYNVDFSKPIIVLRYSKYSCDSCVDYAEFMFDEFVTKNKYNQYLIIISDYSRFEMDEVNHIVNLDRQELDLPMEQTDIPYIFILEKDRVRNLIIPERKFEKFLEFYFRKIESLSILK